MSRSRLGSLAVAGALSTAALVGTVGPAQAAGDYRFWGYSHQRSGHWVSATTGPDGFTPADGAVEGWRFALAGTTPRLPRGAPSFDEICKNTAAVSGKKRVGLVIDPGRPADAPKGATAPAPTAECVVVDSSAKGAQVLTAAGDVRRSKGLVCAVDGYPATGCGEAVPASRVSAAAKAPDTPVTIPVVGASPATAPAQEDQGGSSTGKVWAGVGVVAVLAALAALALRKRRLR